MNAKAKNEAASSFKRMAAAENLGEAPAMNDRTRAPVRVGIVEDDDRIRESFVSLIERANGFRCVAAHANAEEALASIPGVKPDVVLMDINLPRKSGIDCVQELKAMLPETQILMLTVYEDAEKVFQSLQAGASGYLLKRTPPEELLEAIQEVMEGGSPMSSLIARKVVASFQRPKTALRVSLTPREDDILQNLARGFLYKEIAEQLGISITTVRTHLRNIYEKLQVQNRTEAVVKFLGQRA